MNKRIMAVLLALTLLCLMGCRVDYNFMRYDSFEVDAVVSIEIYDLRGTEYFGSDFLSAETPVYTIPAEQKAAFLDDLAKVGFVDVIIYTIAAVDPSFCFGDWVVRINHTDGFFTLISDGGYGLTLDEQGMWISSNHYAPGSDVWRGLLQGYVPEEIFTDNKTA